MPASLTGQTFHDAFRIDAWGLVMSQSHDNGHLMVLAVDEAPPSPGLSAGDRIVSIDGVTASSIPRAQRILWQGVGGTVRVEIERPDGSLKSLDLPRP